MSLYDLLSSSATANAKELMLSAMAESVSSTSISDITGAKSGGVSSVFVRVCVCVFVCA